LQRIDLKGDGVEEVIINATRLKESGRTQSATAGDYSIVLVNKLAE
jgi:hypothetical protein